LLRRPLSKRDKKAGPTEARKEKTLSVFYPAKPQKKKKKKKKEETRFRDALKKSTGRGKKEKCLLAAFEKKKNSG